MMVCYEFLVNCVQEQQFTLILQTLQQLRDVYGDSVDKINMVYHVINT